MFVVSTASAADGLRWPQTAVALVRGLRHIRPEHEKTVTKLSLSVMMSEMSHAAEQPVESSTVLVDEGVSTPPPASSFSKVVRSPSAPPRGAVGLLLFCLRVITADEDLTVAQLRNPTYEGSVNYLCRVLENGRMDTVSKVGSAYFCILCI